MSMKRNFFVLVVSLILMGITLNAQGKWKYIDNENINFKMPDEWKIINSSKPKGPMNIKMYDPNGTQFVEIRSERSKINLKTRANDIATLRSQQQYFEYMQIDKVKSAKFNGHEAQLLSYTNTHMNEVYKGSIYSFVKEGYTYTVECYGEDKPETQKFLQKIAATINVNSADKKANITDKTKDYTEQGWATQEIDNSAEIAEKEAKKAEERAAKEAEKIKEKQQKAQDKAQKAVEKQQKKLEKQQKELEKQQKELEKKQEKAQKAKEKAEKKAEKAEKKRIEKENQIKKLQNQQQDIDKELNKIASEQSKLGEEYGSAQLKNDQKKMEKIQKKQTKLADKVVKLNKERDSIIKKLSKF